MLLNLDRWVLFVKLKINVRLSLVWFFEHYQINYWCFEIASRFNQWSFGVDSPSSVMGLLVLVFRVL